MMKRQRTIIMMVLVLLSLYGSAFGIIGITSISGSGTEIDPYTITSYYEFLEFADPANAGIYWALGVYTRLDTDIDLDPALPFRITYTTAVIAPDTDPNYFFQGTEFQGVFDGNGHKIENLVIDTLADADPNNDDNDYLALFGYINNGQVISLGVDADITGGDNSNCLGGLVARNHEGDIENCYSTGDVTGGDNSNYLGGLCGENGYMGGITSCYATGSVTGGNNSHDLGGLCGYNNQSSITNCYATGSVQGKRYIGGLCGSNTNSSIANCYATGSVQGNLNLGGLCGLNYYVIIKCYWNQDTAGITYSDGGWAVSTAQMMTESTYIGWNNGEWVIDEGNDYPHLVWEGTPGTVIDYVYPRTYPGNGNDIPFELDDANDLVSMSLRPDDWDKNFILTGDINMSSVSDYRPPMDFTGRFDGADHTITNLSIDAGVLGKYNQLGLFGRIGPGAEITHLGLLDVTVVGGDNSGKLGGLCGFNHSGSISHCYVTGSVNGGGNSHDLGGLCGNSGYTGASISHCYATGSVNGGGNSECLGGLCGVNLFYGSISHCYAASSVSGDSSSSLGGLCGRNAHGSITYSYAKGNVTGENDSIKLGGLCGDNSGLCNISNCYATGSVTGGDNSEKLGGLCGDNGGSNLSITNCYATASVTGGIDSDYLGGLCGHLYGGIISDCFWNNETSGVADGIGTNNGGTVDNVQGLTSVQMSDPNYYLQAEWDFVDETNNGDADIWWMYPAQPPILADFLPGYSNLRKGDVNLDDVADFLDFAIFAEHWLEEFE